MKTHIVFPSLTEVEFDFQNNIPNNGDEICFVGDDSIVPEGDRHIDFFIVIERLYQIEDGKLERIDVVLKDKEQ